MSKTRGAAVIPATMRIGILTNYHLDHVGGAEEALDRLATHWHDAEHQVTLFSAPSPPNERRRPWQPRYQWVPFARPFSTRFGLSRLVRLLRRAHVQCPFDIVLAADAYWPGHVARQFWLRTGVPFVVCSHGSDIREGSRFLRRQLTKERLVLALREAAGVATISSYMAARVHELVQPSGIVRRVGNGWPDEWRALPRTEPLIKGTYLFAMGRLVPVKGFQTLVDAYALLWPKFPRIPLIIAGEGPLLPELIQRAQRHGLPVRRDLPDATRAWQGVCFPGFVHGPMKRSLVEHAHVGVCPSIWQEPLGMVVLEMLCRGVPVVASRVGGIPDMIRDGLNGQLVAAGEHVPLAAGLDRLLSHPDERDRMAQATQPSVEPYRWSQIANNYLSLFDAVLAAGGTGAVERREKRSAEGRRFSWRRFLSFRFPQVVGDAPPLGDNGQAMILRK